MMQGDIILILILAAVVLFLAGWGGALILQDVVAAHIQECK